MTNNKGGGFLKEGIFCFGDEIPTKTAIPEDRWVMCPHCGYSHYTQKTTLQDENNLDFEGGFVKCPSNGIKYIVSFRGFLLKSKVAESLRVIINEAKTGKLKYNLNTESFEEKKEELIDNIIKFPKKQKNLAK